MTTKAKQTCADRVRDVADSQIEDIRLMLCPKESDVELVDDGTLGTVIQLGEVVERYNHEYTSYYRDESGALDLDEFISDHWDDLRESAYERWTEYGLSFDYMTPDDSQHYFCFLISTGGPGTEIRFYANHDLTLYRAEFWLLDWFDGAHVVVTSDDTVNAVWDQFAETGFAESVRNAAAVGV